jgi:hypothetical protein
MDGGVYPSVEECTHAHVDEEGKYAHMKGTDVCVCINEEGTDARIIEEGAEACINKETTEAHINEELTNTHSDNIDEESHTYDKEGRYAHMKEIYVSSIEQNKFFSIVLILF